ncbi:hypothetical protein EON83_29495 [bacterium]|nr:MAG: hypothetical protein EON83_29495 [bacterium]
MGDRWGWDKDSFCDEIIITSDEFHHILRLACQGYLQCHPRGKPKLRHLFAKAEIPFDES